MLRFFTSTPDEKLIYKCEITEPYIVPAIGDVVHLPFGDYDDGELYKVKGRFVYDGNIEYVCKLYDWED